MTDKERLEKLQKAHDLIREVEFSYPDDDDTRHGIYKDVCAVFSFTGTIGPLMQRLKESIK